MRHRYVAGALCALSVGLMVLGYYLSHPVLARWCEVNNPACMGQDVLFGIGHPLLLSIWLLPIFFFALIFISKEIFQSWWKFAIIFSILPLVFIIVTPPLGQSISPDRTLVTQWMVHLFVIVNILFIAWKYWQLRKRF